MAGHMGDERVTVHNLEVVGTDPEEGLLLVKGAVPGAKGSWIMIKDAVKKEQPEGVPYPGAVRVNAAAEAAEAPAAEAPAGGGEGAGETAEENKE